MTFYAEMLDDRIEEGLSEEEAVAAAGAVEEIVRQTVDETPLAKIAKERVRPKRHLKAWEIVLLALGSPVWLSLGIAAAAVILAVYVSLWDVIVSLWAVFGGARCLRARQLTGLRCFCRARERRGGAGFPQRRAHLRRACHFDVLRL